MKSVENISDFAGIVWDKPHFYLNGEVFIPKIYEMTGEKFFVPDEYNTVSVYLDGKISADLDWKEQEKLAQKLCDQGYQLFWHLDLGLFDKLHAPLSNQTQFLSLILSLEHFRDTLWKRYKQQTVGICIYKGSINFTMQLQWDDHLYESYLSWGKEGLGSKFDETNPLYKMIFSRDTVAEYLTMMINRMPDFLQFFAFVEIPAVTNFALESQLTNREKFDRLQLVTRHSKLPDLSFDEKTKVGVCLPNHSVVDPDIYQNLECIFQHLSKQNILFRVIPEEFLIHEWDGLDYLILDPAGLSVQGRRKLQGFLAAGGIIATPL